MLRQSLVTTLRTTADVWIRPSNDLPRLFPSACLRMMDHHLHKSGILQPKKSSVDSSKNSSSSSRIYDHAWLCASQSVQVRAHADLLDMDQVTSHVWINRVGSSSVQLGHALTMTDQDDGHPSTVLAVARRVFVRKELNQPSLAVPFSDTESTRYLQECGPTTTTQLCLEKEIPPVPPRLDTSSILSHLSRRVAEKEPAVWTVPVGMCHVNFGGHADHAFLAETAHHALWRNTSPQQHQQGDDSYSLALQYLAEVSLDDTLRCYVVRNDDENANDGVVIVVTSRSSSKNSTSPNDPDELIPVLVAQGNA